MREEWRHKILNSLSERVKKTFSINFPRLFAFWNKTKITKHKTKQSTTCVKSWMIWNGCFLVFAFFSSFLPRIETDHKSLRWLFREKSKRSGPEEKLLSLVSFIEHLIVMDLSEVLRTKRINPSDAFSSLFHNWVFFTFPSWRKLLFYQKKKQVQFYFLWKSFPLFSLRKGFVTQLGKTSASLTRSCMHALESYLEQ